MGLYRDCILPWGINRVLDRADCRELRQRATRGLHGTVLEVGFGSGLNLPHYPDRVERICAVDPSTFGRRLAARRIKACSIPIEFVGLTGESIPLAAGSYWELASRGFSQITFLAFRCMARMARSRSFTSPRSRPSLRITTTVR